MTATSKTYALTRYPSRAPDPAAAALAELAATVLSAGPRAGWPAQARCRDAGDDLHYPEGTTGAPAYDAAVERAKQDCAWCPVLAECRAWALSTREPHGIWGGTTPEERAAIHTAETARTRAARRAS